MQLGAVNIDYQLFPKMGSVHLNFLFVCFYDKDSAERANLGAVSSNGASTEFPRSPFSCPSILGFLSNTAS